MDRFIDISFLRKGEEGRGDEGEGGKQFLPREIHLCTRREKKPVVYM